MKTIGLDPFLPEIKFVISFTRFKLSLKFSIGFFSPIFTLMFTSVWRFKLIIKLLEFNFKYLILMTVWFFLPMFTLNHAAP